MPPAVFPAVALANNQSLQQIIVMKIHVIFFFFFFWCILHSLDQFVIIFKALNEIKSYFSIKEWIYIIVFMITWSIYIPIKKMEKGVKMLILALLQHIYMYINL